MRCRILISGVMYPLVTSLLRLRIDDGDDSVKVGGRADGYAVRRSLHLQE